MYAKLMSDRRVDRRVIDVPRFQGAINIYVASYLGNCPNKKTRGAEVLRTVDLAMQDSPIRQQEFEIERTVLYMYTISRIPRSPESLHSPETGIIPCMTGKDKVGHAHRQAIFNLRGVHRTAQH